MMRRSRSILLALGLFALGIPASGAAAHDTAQDAALARGIAKALVAHGFSGHGTGVAVADLATGELIYQRNGTRPLLPASTEKLFTSVAAFSTLRPDFRFATTVVGAGARAGPTWNGDLYLVGSGDPTFSSDDVDALAAQVRAQESAASAGAFVATRPSSTLPARDRGPRVTSASSRRRSRGSRSIAT